MSRKKSNREADARLADAVENGNLEAAAAALDAGANPDGRRTRRRDNLPPLFVAVLRRRPDMVRLLLERGANPNVLGDLAISPNCTPLFAADCACARILLEHGADPAARDAIGQTALFYDTLLRSGEEAEEVERVKLLLQAGTPGDAVSGNGSTALFYVKEPESVRLLLEAGAPADARSGEYEMLNALCQHHRNPQSTKLLLEAGADPNVTDEEWGCGVCGWGTPVESVRLLLEHGFNPNLVREDDYYTTPPIARGVSLEVARLLQQAGADVNLRYLACEFLDHSHCLDRKLATTPVGYSLYVDDPAAAEILLQLPGVKVGMLELYWALRAGEDARIGYRSSYRPVPDTDAAIALLKKYGNLEIDDATLAAYRADPDSMLTPDFFLDGILKPRPSDKGK